MKKSLLLLSSVLVFSLSIFQPSYGADHEPFDVATNEASKSPTLRAVAAETDLKKIRAHIHGYAKKMGVPEKVKDVGEGTFCSCLRTTYNGAERFLLEEISGQVLARFLAIAMDDFADGKLDGVANGKKVSYSQEVANLLGVEISEAELRSEPLDQPLVNRLLSLATEVGTLIIDTNGQTEKVLRSLGDFAEKKMHRARKYLASALIRETDRIIALELGNGAFDGLDSEGLVINWKSEMKQSVESALSQVLDGVR